jgi:hypothetical protein
MAGKKNEVAEAKNTDIGNYDWGEHSGVGFEDTKIADLSIPFVNIMQPMSEIVVEQKIDGVKAGDMVNSVTGEIVKQPMLAIPVHQEGAIVEWRPRNKGGGLISRMEFDDPIWKAALAKNGGSNIPPKDAEGKRVPFKSPDGNDLVETYYTYFLQIEDDEVVGYFVAPFSSTKIGKYRDFKTSMFMVKGKPPIYAFQVTLETVKEIREAGTSYNYLIKPSGENWRSCLINPTTDGGRKLLEEGQNFASMISDGLATPDYDSIKEQGSDDESGQSSGGGAGNADAGDTNSDEIPF